MKVAFFTKAETNQICEMLAEGYTPSYIASKLKFSQHYVYRIANKYHGKDGFELESETWDKFYLQSKIRTYLENNLTISDTISKSFL